MVLTQQRSIGCQPPDPIVPGYGTRGAQLVFSAPCMEMLHRALCQVLPLRNKLRCTVLLDEHDIDAALSQFDREPGADRAATNDHHLGPYGMHHMIHVSRSDSPGLQIYVLGLQKVI
ncbi:protein of unknown function [Pseudorhizobium banfieldiae]|uniref:Uncharacterized protein n=1 Tax=Pseudorhizobium banfieldiae TaxID=1125847 RepID=L0NCY7_9HYPH|nr:protein of unknown function [Pseudorhizobium banfieldiae]